MLSANALGRAILLGMATGIRSMTPLAMLGWAARSGRMELPDRVPYTWLALPRVSNALLAAAGGEMVADKLPFVPSRTTRGPLMVRMAIGAVAGGLAFKADDSSVSLGAVTGGLAAAWGAFAGLSVRMQLTQSGMPPVLAALLGDGLAVALASTAALQRESKVR